MSQVSLIIASSTSSYNSFDESKSIQRTEPSDASPLNRYIVTDVIDNSPVFESNCHKITRIGLLGIAIFIGMIGNLTFIPISGGPAFREGNLTSTPLPGDPSLPEDGSFNEPYRWTLVAGNTIGFGILTTWVLLKLVNESLRKQSLAEQEIPNPTISKCTSIMSKTTAITCGLASQIPVAFMAYAYNDNSLAHAGVIVLSNASYPIYSLDLSFKSAFQKRSFTNFEKQLYSIKTDLVKNLYRKKDEFLSMTPAQKTDFVQKIKNLDEKQKLQTYLTLLLENSKDSISNTPFPIKAGRTASKVIGLFLSSMLLSHYWMGGYEGTKIVTDAEPVTQSVAAFVTACNAYLTVDTIINSVASMFDTSVQIVQGKYRTPFSVQLMPKTATALKVLGLGVAGTSWGATVQFSRDYFDDPLEPVVEFGASIAVASLIHYAMQSVIDEGVTMYTAHYAKGQKQDFAKVMLGVDKVIDKINAASMKNFASGLKDWSEIFDTSSFNSNVTIEDLTRYLNAGKEIQLSSTV